MVVWQKKKDKEKKRNWSELERIYGSDKVAELGLKEIVTNNISRCAIHS